MSIQRLSQDLIANLHCPEGKIRSEHCDSLFPGLYVETRSTSPGQGTYYLRYKDAAGKTCHQKIAKVGEIDLAEARKRAKTLKAEIALGADPRGEAKAQRAVMTFSEFFEERYMPHAKTHKRSWKRDEQLYSRIKPAIGAKRLNQITGYEIQAFHSRLLEEGLAPATCDHHSKLIKHVFNLATTWNLLEGKNPAAGTKMFNPHNQIEHIPNPEEFKRLMEVLLTDPSRPACTIALFLLSTGARLQEALDAQWDEIDLPNRGWHIPATRSKSKRRHTYPLSEDAVRVLESLDTKDGFKHLFVNKQTQLPYTSISKVWDRLRKLAGLPRTRLHDLRHSRASALAEHGVSLYIIQKTLGHAQSKTTERYLHMTQDTLVSAANRVALFPSELDRAGRENEQVDEPSAA